jgi:hypothetical protein
MLSGPPPRSRQPVVASQVRGLEIGMGFDDLGGGLDQPSNQGPDERPSTPMLPRKCFFQFWIT